MDDELLYRGIENWDRCYYSSLHVSICLKKQDKKSVYALMFDSVFSFVAYNINN